MRTLPFLVLALAASSAAAQQPAPRPSTPARRAVAKPAAARVLTPVEKRIQAVETNLLPSVRIKGRPLTNMTIAARMRKFSVTGVSVAVINEFGIEWAKGYGVADSAVFLAGAAGEPVMAAVALVMSQNRQLDLDRDANRYLKTWKIPKSSLTKSKPVTVSSLLTHTSGFPVISLQDYTVETVPTLRQVLAPLALDQIPTLEYRPQGGDYVVLEQLLTDAGRKPVADLAAELVLSPLGMTRSAFGPPLPAAFAFQTTPSDLARFAIEIQSAASGRTGKVLKQETAQLMLTPPPYGPEGLGLLPSGGSSALRFTERGRTGVSDVEMVAFVNHGQGAVVMAHRSPGSGQLIAEIVNAVAKTYGWLGYLSAEKVVANVDPRVYDRFAGTYATGNRTMAISRRGRGLFAGSGKETVELIPESVSDFFTVDGDLYSFVFDEKGKVGTMTVRRRDGETRWDRR